MSPIAAIAASTRSPPPLEVALSFEEAIGASDELLELRAQRAAISQKRELDRKLPAQTQRPQLQVMPGARISAGADNGFELQATITQTWNLNGQGRAQRESARAETEVWSAETRAVALERRLGAAEVWLRLYSAQQRMALLERDRMVLKSLLAQLERSLAAGVTTRVELGETQALMTQLSLEGAKLGGEVHDLGLQLAFATGQVSLDPCIARGDLPQFDLPPANDLRRRFSKLDGLPMVVQHRLRARAARAEMQLAERSGGWSLQSGASMQLESTGETVLFGVAGVSLPSRGRNLREQVSAQMHAQVADAEGDRSLRMLTTILGIALHELEHTQRQVELLREQAIPELERLVRVRATAVELGEGTRTRWLEAQHRKNVAERELVAANAEHVWARARVWLYLEALENHQ